MFVTQIRPAGFEQLSTGQLHLMVQILAGADKKEAHQRVASNKTV